MDFLDDDIEPGVLYPVYFIKCAICYEIDVTNEYFPQQAAKSARNDGWVKTRTKGWVCMKCYSEHKKRAQEV